MSDDNGERLYNPDGYGCRRGAAAVVAVMFALLVLPGVLLVVVT